VPWLATEYAWNAITRLTLAKSARHVKWSDGKPFHRPGRDYTFNLLKSNDALIGTGSNVLREYVDSISAPDASTVSFKFNTVYTLALYDLANQIIVPRHLGKMSRIP